MKRINILFTGVGRRVELLQAFRNAALVLNKDLKIYGADMTGTAPALAYCDYTRKVVAMKDEKYIDNLLSICEADKIDLLIPTIDTDLLVLAENKEKFEVYKNELKIYLSDNEKYILDRKVELSKRKSASDYIRTLILFGFVYDVDYSYLRQYNETLGKISGNMNQIAKRVNSTGNVYEEDMAEVKAIMDEVWRTQKAMLKKQPLIHNG